MINTENHLRASQRSSGLQDAPHYDFRHCVHILHRRKFTNSPNKRKDRELWGTEMFRYRLLTSTAFGGTLSCAREISSVQPPGPRGPSHPLFYGRANNFDWKSRAASLMVFFCRQRVGFSDAGSFRIDLGVQLFCLKIHIDQWKFR